MNAKRFLSLFLLISCLLTFVYACDNQAEVTSSIDESSNSTTDESINDVSTNESSVETEESSEEEVFVPQDTIVNFLACPDNLIHPSIYYDGLEYAAAANGVDPDYKDLHNAQYSFDHIYEDVAQQIADADISFINQETLIGGDCKNVSGYPCFNSPIAMGEKVIDLGFDLVNVVHNHMLDSGDTRFLEHCNTFFTERDIEVLGYYPNEKSTEKITVIENQGIKIAFLSYTYGTNGISIPSSSEFVIPYFDEALIEKQVAIAKQEADVIIVACHWGYENTYNANDAQKYYAKYLCELGVDVVLGMHSHCIQPMEWMTSEAGKETLVIYSLGNFLSGMKDAMNSLAGMLSLEIVKDGETGEITIESPTFIPIVTHYIKKSAVASDDTGFRDFKIYYLEDYTEELAAEHGVHRYERSNGTSLVGGNYSLDTLWQTINKYIAPEFLNPELTEEENSTSSTDGISSESSVNQ